MITARIKRTKRKSKKAIGIKKLIAYTVAFGAFSFSALFLSGLFAYKLIFQDLALAFSSGSYDISREPLYTVGVFYVNDFSNDPVLVDKISYVMVDRKNKKLLTIKVPVNHMIDMPGNFGEETFEKIAALGMLNAGNNSKAGWEFANQALFKFFGYKVDRYIAVDASLAVSFASFFDSGQFLAFSLSDIKKLPSSLKTNMSLRDLYNLYTFVNLLPSDRFIKQDIKTEDKFIDEMVTDLTFDLGVSQERKSIAVLNGSGISGAASFASRVVQNLGGRVVFLGNSRERYEVSYLIVDDFESETARQILQSFPVKKVILKSDLIKYSIDESEVERSDITLIVGFDIGNRL